MSKLAKKLQSASHALDENLTWLGQALNSVELILADNSFTGGELVDLAARIRAGKTKLEGLDRLVSGVVMDDIGASGRLAGDMYEACRVTQTKIVLDNNKVKEYLGVKLPNFQTTQHVQYIQYKPKV